MWRVPSYSSCLGAIERLAAVTEGTVVLALSEEDGRAESGRVARRLPLGGALGGRADRGLGKLKPEIEERERVNPLFFTLLLSCSSSFDLDSAEKVDVLARRTLGSNTEGDDSVREMGDLKGDVFSWRGGVDWRLEVGVESHPSEYDFESVSSDSDDNRVANRLFFTTLLPILV